MSVMRLEEELNHKLFRRTPKEIILTEHAEYLLPRAKKVLAIIDETEAYFRQGMGKDESIPVMFVMGSYEEVAGEVVRKFQQDYVNIEVIERHDPVCEKAVLDGDAELAVTVGPIDDSKFDATWLYSTKNVMIMHKDNPLAKKNTLSVYDLKDIPIVALNETMKSFTNFRYSCRHAGFEPQVKSFSDSVMLLYYLADTDQAICLSTLSLANRMARSNVVAVPFEDPIFDRDLYVIKKKGVTPSYYASVLEQMLVADSLHRESKPIQIL
jgi:DNA-binding transcriptional LysR family regulator